MAQKKKTEVRDALLDSAYRLFAKRGYVRTSVAQIAARARVSEANFYVYFKSKLEIFFGVYEPWLRERIHRLEGQLTRERTARARVRRVLSTLWRDLPADDNGFTNNLMQALSTTDMASGYRPTLLHWVEERLETILEEAVPPRRWARLRKGKLVHILMMAQDGLAMGHHLNPGRPCGRASIDMMVVLLLGEEGRRDRRSQSRAILIKR